MSLSTHYSRVLIKLSGEALLEEGHSTGISPIACKKIAESIKSAYDKKVQIGIVIGGGNIFRGRTLVESMNIAPVNADEIGMLATLLNGLVLKEALIQVDCPSAVLCAFPVGTLIEPYSHEKARQYLDQNLIVIFVGGTGHPYFTTDTAASLRALEIGAQVFLKATKVDGVYSADPKKNKTAKKYDRLTYREVLDQKLEVMDSTAVSLCRENKLPIIVFDMHQKEDLLKVIQHKNCGTLITGD